MRIRQFEQLLFASYVLSICGWFQSKYLDGNWKSLPESKTSTLQIFRTLLTEQQQQCGIISRALRVPEQEALSLFVLQTAVTVISVILLLLPSLLWIKLAAALLFTRSLSLFTLFCFGCIAFAFAFALCLLFSFSFPQVNEPQLWHAFVNTLTHTHTHYSCTSIHSLALFLSSALTLSLPISARSCGLSTAFCLWLASFRLGFGLFWCCILFGRIFGCDCCCCYCRLFLAMPI